MHAVAQKSPEAFRTISEVAAELDVPQHVLRFWETKFPAVKPLKRGGGRRYYRPDDVDLLRGIRALLYSDGLTIKGVQKILRERGARTVLEMGRNVSGFAPVSTVAAEAPRGGSNVHPFPRDPELPLGPVSERQRFETLLTELLDLKARLRAARGSL